MTPVGFKPTISAGERPQTYALDRAATVTNLSHIHLLTCNTDGNITFLVPAASKSFQLIFLFKCKKKINNDTLTFF